MAPSPLALAARPVWSGSSNVLRGAALPHLRRRAVNAAATAALGTGARDAAAATDSLVWDIAAGPQYVDPVMGTSAQAKVTVLQNVYERLVWYDAAGMEPIPWLATGWEVKDNGQRYVFKLRKGIKFQDGGNFDAKAVKFSFDRAVLLDDPTGMGSFFPTGTAAPASSRAPGSSANPSASARTIRKLRSTSTSPPARSR